MTEERKFAILFAATILAARKLIDLDPEKPNMAKGYFVGIAFGFGLRRVFPAEMILNLLRRQAYEALLIRASPIALRAYPQAKATFLRIGFSKVHGRPIVETSDSGNHVQLIRVSVLTQDEVSTIDVVVDETIRLRTGIRERLCSVTIAVHEAPIKPHLDMMLVTKCAKFLARLGSRHRPSSGTPPNEPPSETVYQWNTPVPLDFGAVPQLPTFIRQRCSGVKRLFPHRHEYLVVVEVLAESKTYANRHRNTRKFPEQRLQSFAD